jgi:hypothetical protein
VARAWRGRTRLAPSADHGESTSPNDELQILWRDAAMGAAAAPGADTGVTSLPSAACPATGAAPPEPVAADGEVDLPSACAANPASDNSANVDAAKVEAEAAGNGVASADANPAAVAKRTISVGLEVSRVNMFALGNYTFGRKDTESRGQEARGAADRDIAAHREKRFLERGMRRSVAAVLLVHAHNFPHVLLLQQTSGSGNFALPGGRLRPGEGEEEGLRRKLTAKLSPVGGDADGPGWDVGDEREFRMTVRVAPVRKRQRLDRGRCALTVFESSHPASLARRAVLALNQSPNGGTSTSHDGDIPTSRRTSRSRRNSWCCIVLRCPRRSPLPSPKTCSLSPSLSSNCTAIRRASAASSPLFPRSSPESTSTQGRRCSTDRRPLENVVYSTAAARP